MPNPHSGALTTAAAPGVWAQPEQTSAGRDPSSGAAYTQAEPEAISYEADAARAQRDEADARADVQQALRDEAQRRSDIEQAQADEKQALLDANRTLEESEPPPNSRSNSVEHIRE
jgi:thioesterase domain-containing protein